MEKARNLVVMPYGGCWSDLGGWEAVWQTSSPDADGTAASPGALAIDGRDTLLRSEAQGQRIVDIGLEYIVAIATPEDGRAFGCIRVALVVHRANTYVSGERLRSFVVQR